MRTLLLCLVVGGLCACHSSSVKVRDDGNALPAYKYDTLEGSYVGNFGGSAMHIILTHVTGRHATGYDLYKGLRRNISGTMEPAGSAFSFQMSEPGNHPYDGQFTFTIDTTSYELAGTWAPLNNKNLAARSFTFKKIIDTGEDRHENISNHYADSIGEFTFHKAGTCTYEYYPRKDGKPAEQMVRVNGTWSTSDSLYIIDWEANPVFPAAKSTFVHRQVRPDSTAEYRLDLLVGEGRTLFMEGDEGILPMINN